MGISSPKEGGGGLDAPKRGLAILGKLRPTSSLLASMASATPAQYTPDLIWVNSSVTDSASVRYGSRDSRAHVSKEVHRAKRWNQIHQFREQRENARKFRFFQYDKETPSPYLDNPSLLRREEPATLRSTTLNSSSDSRDVLLVYTHGKSVYRDEDGPEAISDDGGGQITSKGLPRAEGSLASEIRSANPSLQTWLTTFRRDAFHTLPLRLDCEGQKLVDHVRFHLIPSSDSRVHYLSSYHVLRDGSKSLSTWRWVNAHDA